MRKIKKNFYPHWKEKNRLMYNYVEKENERKEEADKMKKYEARIVEEICKECNISKRKSEELLKVSLFYGDDIREAKNNIINFMLNLKKIKK